jgi:hypothetical protein
MRIIIPSRGRHDYAPTLEHMPHILKSQVEVWVPKVEYKAYSSSPLFSGVKLKCWPTNIDCIPKTRRFLYENVDGSYMVADDDIKLMVWDKSKANFSAATTNEKGFMRGLELAFQSFDDHHIVGIANTFMTSMRVKDKRTFEFSDVAFGMVGFSADRPKIDFKTFFFTDTAMPMQVLKKGGTAHMTARIAYNLRSNKKLLATGTTPYRTDGVVKYSAISLAQQMPGHVSGMKNTGHLGGGWSLKKSFLKPNVQKYEVWAREFAAEHGLSALPPLVDLDLDTPMDELFAQYRKNWKLAKQGKGNKLP